MTEPPRCAWATDAGPSMTAYHDTEWGVPAHDDIHLFEMLTLEGAQAGLSWKTILDKREGYRRAFAGFDPAKVARFDAAQIRRLLNDPTIVRNRLKIESTVANAKLVLSVQREQGSLDSYLWPFVGGASIQRHRDASGPVSESEESRAMSRDLKGRGFGFVGPTVCYALMQATGMVQGHVAACFRWAELERLG
ncbi:MAG: DNA-3-methyladenine glycosylase I [Actinomycetota bacterium]